MLGRRLDLPIDKMIAHPRSENDATPPDYVQQLDAKLERTFESARKHIKRAGENQAKGYDKTRHMHSYNTGDAVWLFDPTRQKNRSPKLQQRWKGPCKVLKKITDVTYRIQISPRGKPRVVHHNRLKQYTGDNKPEWFNVDVEPVGEPAVVKEIEALAVNQNKAPKSQNKFIEVSDSENVTPVRKSKRTKRPWETFGH